MVNQRKIAEVLNMTQQAVSAALRPLGSGETSRVAPETRQLVLETAKRLGYRSNRYASVLKSGKSRLVAILYRNMNYDWIEKVRSISVELESNGLIPWSYDMRSYKNRPGELADILLASKVEGVVVTQDFYSSLYKPLLEMNVPLVSLQGVQLEGVPWVGPDKVTGYYEVARHLFEQGCRKIQICRPQTRHVYEARPKPEHPIEPYAGLLRYHREMNWPEPEDSLVFLPDDYDEALDQTYRDYHEYELGYLLARQALKQKTVPDGLIFPNDNMAMGGICACRDAGMRVPEEICVTGFNGEKQTLYSWIPVTTVGQPIASMSREVAELMVECINNPATERLTTRSLHPCEFMPRQSSLRKAALSSSTSHLPPFTPPAKLAATTPKIALS